MSEIRKLKNEDFLQLAGLYAKMCECLPKKLNPCAAVSVLLNDIQSQKDFMAFGYFEGDELVGFTTGYALCKKTFYFSGIYVRIKNINLKKLIDYSFDYVNKHGYPIWEMDCTNPGITSIMEKYGAKPVYTRYSIGE